ncbi:MAG: DUF4080 domain-containing protein [Clostridia bacterium]|nr:DUF4080 domain-containing protein [Clostridia bacterium]
MRAVICGINSQYIHSTLAPWCLLAGVRAYAPSVTAEVVEGTINESPDAVFTRIMETAPQVVSFSCYIWNIEAVLRLTARLKRAVPGLYVVLGGPEVSYRAGALLREEPSVDYVLSGEGERPFAMLLESLHDGASLNEIPGLCYRDGDTIIEREPYVTSELPPSPYCSEYFDTLNGRIAYLETSRGCPFSCAFCLSGRCGGVRYYPLERAQNEILLLANSGAKTVKFVDRTFNADRKRALSIIRFIREHYGTDIPRDVCFHFEIAGDLLDEETLTVLSESPAGLFQMEIGIQSFHAPTLAAIARKTDIERLKRNVSRLLACQTVHVHIDLIAGLPQEDINTFTESFNAAYLLSPHMLQLGFLKLLYGAPMREHPTEYPCEYSKLPPYEVTRTPWLSEDELRHLHRIETVLDRLYNSGRFRRTLAYLLDATGDTPLRLFERLSNSLPHERVPLDVYTEQLYAVCSVWDTVDAENLRGHMACDRVATNPSGILPPCLRANESERKRLKRLADTDDRYRRPASVKRGTAYVDGRLVYADYTTPHPVTGEYPLHIFTEDCLTRKTRFLLFDLDGTLTDPALGITRSVQYALRHFGIEETNHEKLLSYIGPPLLDSFKGYGLSDEEAREALRVYRVYFADIGLYENEVYEGIRDFLQDAQRAGYGLIMATSKPEMYACRLMQHFGLTEYFACIAGSDMAETRADKSSVIRYALARVGVTDVSETVMIGDRKYDVEGARAFGMPSVAVTYGYGSREELEAAGADRIVDSVQQLYDIFL